MNYCSSSSTLYIAVPQAMHVVLAYQHLARYNGHAIIPDTIPGWQEVLAVTLLAK